MPKYSPSNKALIVLPFWNGDRTAAIGLSHLLADLQPIHSEDFDLLFVSRFDAEPVDAATIKHVSRKFNCFRHVSARRETGWPSGCNGTMGGALEWIYRKSAAGQIPGYKMIWFAEGDTVPLTRDCFAYLLREWDRLSRSQTIVCAGALVPDGGKEHINGGAIMLSGNQGFLRWVSQTVSSMRARAGWDFAFARDFRDRGWANLSGVRSFWQTPTMSPERITELARSGVVWVHGIKDGSGIRWARENLL